MVPPTKKSPSHVCRRFLPALAPSRATSPPSLREPPRVGVVESIVERFDALLSLPLRDLPRVGLLEEARRELSEPLWLDGEDLAHVLLG